MMSQTVTPEHPAMLLLLERYCDAVQKWLESHPALFLSAAGVLFFISAVGHSHAKDPWLDEVLLMTIAGLPGVSDIWDALKAGIQVDPPLMHTLVHFLFRFLPNDALVARLPGMVGYWALSLSFFLLVRRYSTPLYAAAGFFVPGMTFLRAWAWEARPYGLVVGAAAIAIVCWDFANTHERRALSLMGMAVAIAATVSLHFFGVLVLGGLLTGELAKVVVRRRIDWASIASILIGASPLLAWRPILNQNFAIMRPLLLDNSSFDKLYGFYEQTLFLAPLVVFVALTIIVYVWFGAIPREQTGTAPISAGERFLLAAALGFFCLPVVAYVQAHFVTGMFYSKYILLGVFGPMIAVPLLLSRFTAQSSIIGLLLLISLGANAGIVYARGIFDLRRHTGTYPDLSTIATLIPEPNPDVAVASSLHYIPLNYLSHSEFRSHLLYLQDPWKSLAYTGQGNLDMVYQQVASRYPAARILNYDSFTQSHRHFYVLVSNNEDEGWTEWLLRHLRRISAKERYLGAAGMFTVLEIELPESDHK